jgi:hypothetical protein
LAIDNHVERQQNAAATKIQAITRGKDARDLVKKKRAADDYNDDDFEDDDDDDPSAARAAVPGASSGLGLRGIPKRQNRGNNSAPQDQPGTSLDKKAAKANTEEIAKLREDIAKNKINEKQKLKELRDFFTKINSPLNDKAEEAPMLYKLNHVTNTQRINIQMYRREIQKLREDTDAMNERLIEIGGKARPPPTHASRGSVVGFKTPSLKDSFTVRSGGSNLKRTRKKKKRN